MYKVSTIKYIGDTLSKLTEANITIYRIAQVLDEPEPTLHNIFKSQKAKYSEDRVIEIMDRIHAYLSDLEGDQLKKKIESEIKIPGNSDCPEIFTHYDLYIKLFEIGLNSKSFTPEDKLRFAIWHRTLTAFKNNLNKENDNE